MTHDTFFKEDGSPSFVLIYKMLEFSALAAIIWGPKDLATGWFWDHRSRPLILHRTTASATSRNIKLERFTEH